MSKIHRILSIVSLYRYIITGVLAVIILGFVGENSILAKMQHQSTIRSLKKEIAKYKEEYARDTKQLNQMDNSLEAIRRIARERYYMKAANEDIFVIEDDEDENE